MNTLATIVLASILILAGCARHTLAPHDQLNGTWQSDLMTVTIDFNKGTWQGVVAGQAFNQPLKLISEQGNVVTFQTGERTIDVAQIQQDGSIVFTKQVTKDDPDGGVPINLKRSANP